MSEADAAAGWVDIWRDIRSQAERDVLCESDKKVFHDLRLLWCPVGCLLVEAEE